MTPAKRKRHAHYAHHHLGKAITALGHAEAGHFQRGWLRIARHRLRDAVNHLEKFISGRSS